MPHRAVQKPHGFQRGSRKPSRLVSSISVSVFCCPQHRHLSSSPRVSLAPQDPLGFSSLGVASTHSQGAVQEALSEGANVAAIGSTAIAAAAGLAAILTTYSKLDSRFSKLDSRFDRLEDKLDRSGARTDRVLSFATTTVSAIAGLALLAIVVRSV